MQRCRRGLIPTRCITIKDENGISCTTTESQEERWRKHFTLRKLGIQVNVFVTIQSFHENVSAQICCNGTGLLLLSPVQQPLLLLSSSEAYIQSKGTCDSVIAISAPLCVVAKSEAASENWLSWHSWYTV